MPKIVYYYFSIKGLGEGPRLLLAYGGEDFEDKMIEKEDWPALKPKAPYGQMPWMEIDGKKYAQSVPIARYLGKKYGLVGADAEEDFEIDEHVELLNDIRIKATQVHYEADKEVANKRHEDFSKNVYPVLLEKLNEIVEKNDGHIACAKLTWGDFVFAGFFGCLKAMLRMPALESKYPAFKKLINNVYSIPKVKAYDEKHPKPDIY